MNADAPIQYRRLPGRGFARAQGTFLAFARISCRLWLGDDHLVQVESMGGYTETYKRFYFRDIQAIILHETRVWMVLNIVLGLLTGSLLILLLATMPKGARWTGEEIAGGIFLGILVVLFGLFFILNLLGGATCRTYLKTAVHLEELPSLRRYRNVQKVMARIQPLIEAAQGNATAETIAPQYAALLADASAVPAVPGQVLRVVDPELTVYASRVHQILFIALLADAFGAVLAIFLPSIPVVLLTMGTGAMVAGSVLVALVKQHQTDLSLAVRLLTWFAAGFTGIGYIIGYVMMVVLAPGAHTEGTQWGYIKAIANLRPLETPWWLGVLTVSAVLAALLGAGGLLLLQSHWREKKTAV
jgi:hypothetical protein